MKIIDLSHEIYNGMRQRFAGPIPTIFDHDFRSSEYFRAVDDCCVLQNHLGTHVDAPRHYDPENGKAVHEIPLENLITEAVVLDLSHKERESEITAEDLEQALARTGEDIQPNEGVLIFTGMAREYDTWDSDKWEESAYSRYPWLSEGAVHWLLAKKIAILGVDTLAPDRSPVYKPTHQILLRDNNVPLIENLCNLDKITKSRITFIALPPKVVGASGFLVRAVAIEN